MHRFGELTIIVLGEFFLKLALGAPEMTPEPFNIYTGLCLLGISLSLWWLYFDHLEHGHLTMTGARYEVWAYSHYPFLAAITAYGVAGSKIFAGGSGETLADEKRLLFTIALAIVLLTYEAIEWASREKDEPLSRKPQPWARIGGAVALLALGIWGGNLGVDILLAVVVAIFLIQVGLDVATRLKRPDSEDSQNLIPEVNSGP
jgi:low temperature requirement protein LtrA